MTKQEKIDFLKELKATINESTEFKCSCPIDEYIEMGIDYFILIGTKDEQIGNLACHYEVLFYSKGMGMPTDVPFVEVHFESATYKSFKGINLPDGLMYDDWKEGKESRIVYTGNDGECSKESVIKRLRKLEKLIGQDLRAAFQRQIPKADTNTKNGYAAYSGNQTVTDYAKWSTGYKCEICTEHKSFVAKDGENYMETHHLIPMANQDKFENSLDQEQNVVCLCPNCHREIHYGKNRLELIEALWKQRETRLEAAGIGITLPELEAYYP